MRASSDSNFTSKEMISILSLSTFSSNISSEAPAHETYTSQLIRDSRACDSYQEFRDRVLLLTRKPLNQEFIVVKIKSSLRKFYCSPPVFSGVRVTRSLVLYVYFVDRCLSFFTFPFGHCVVCSPAIYEF